MPQPGESFAENMRFRLLKGPGNYSICPFFSDFSYEGFRSTLEKLDLIPQEDPYFDAKVRFQIRLNEAYYDLENIKN